MPEAAETEMKHSLRVVIADDHAIFRQALQVVLRHRGSGITVAGEAEDGAEAVRVVGQLAPDVLLLDLGLSKKSTGDVIREVRRTSPGTAIVVLTGHADSESVALAARCGVRGFVLKRGPLEPLLDAIAHVARGEIWADPMLPLIDHREFRRIAGENGAAPANPLRGLSPREVDVLRLVAEGLSNRDIGRELSISEKTVTTHLYNSFEKLGVESRVQAALLYAKHSRSAD